MRNENYQKNADKTAFNLIEIETKQLEKVVELTPKVIALMEKFDGKVYNKRFETALKELDKGLSLDWCGIYGSAFRINYIDFDNRDTKDLNSSCGYAYIHPQYFTMVYMETSNWLDSERKRMHLTDDGRKSFSQYLQSNKESIEVRKSLTMEKVDELRRRKAEIEELVKQLRNDVPSCVRDYFGIKTCPVWN